MARAKTTAQNNGPPHPLPTFCTMPEISWDDERNAPDPLSARDMDSEETREWAEEMCKALEAWRDVRDDPREADARRAYAEHVARYLVGIFPNARVNAEAYAMAAGEELGMFSGDVVKLVGQRARRSSKTLPSIAHLFEWAEAETKRRNAQGAECIKARAKYEMQIQAGREKAEATVCALHERGRCLDLTPEHLRIIHYQIAGASLGIECDGAPTRRARSLIAKLGVGHDGAVAMFERWMRDHLPAWLARADAQARLDELKEGDQEKEDAVWAEYRQASTLARAAANAADADLMALLGERHPTPAEFLRATNAVLRTGAR